MKFALRKVLRSADNRLKTTSKESSPTNDIHQYVNSQVCEISFWIIKIQVRGRCAPGEIPGANKTKILQTFSILIFRKEFTAELNICDVCFIPPIHLHASISGQPEATKNSFYNVTNFIKHIL